MDEHELAWAAGFFDGDGWAALVHDRRRAGGQPHAQINQAGARGVPEVLIRFREAVGVGRVAGPRVEDGRQDLYWWIVSSRADVRRTGELIGPWLSSEKRGQFRAAVGLTFRQPPLASRPWAAGLFDAEGSVSIGKHRTHVGYKVIDASVTQIGAAAAPEELVRFRSIVALGKVNGPYDQAGARGPVYRWRLSRVDEVRAVLHVLGPWIGAKKRQQASNAIQVVDAQPVLPRGRLEWGRHKTHCVHGHEYVRGRVRPYRSRGGEQRRVSEQCLVCGREQARARRSAARQEI